MSVAVARQAPYPVRVQQRRCTKCGKLVSRAAYACRRCGKAQRMRPKTMLLLASAMAIGAMFTVAVFSTGAAIHPDALKPLPPLPTPAPPAAVANAHTPSVTAAALWSAYAHDRAATNRTYLDRSVVVTGAIRSVDRNFEGDMVVRLATPDPLETVNATLASRNDPGLSTLAKGQMISLLCVGRGGPLIGAPLLGSCFIK